MGAFGNSFINGFSFIFFIWSDIECVESFQFSSGFFFFPERTGKCHDTAEEAAARTGAHEAKVSGS